LFGRDLERFLGLIWRSRRRFRKWRRNYLFGEHIAWLRAYRTARLRHAISRGEFADREILSAPKLGLGNRLGKLLSAMRLADALGAKFVFHWPFNSIDGINPADEVFHPDFLLSHHLTELPRRRYVRVGKENSLFPSGIMALRLSRFSHFRGIEVKDVESLRGFEFPLAPLSDCFRRIRFHPRLEIVRKYVDGALPRFALAIHIRRGDTFRGDNRIGGGFVTKQLPLPIIRRILEKTTSERPVLLIGNEMGLNRSLQTKPWIHSLADFQYPGEIARDKTDFFDFLALTKCDAILGGTSNFAIHPGRIGGAAFLTPSDFLSHEEIKACLMAYIQKPPTSDDFLEVALACEYAHRVLPEMLSAKERDFIITSAFRADPHNPTYSIRIAADLLRKKDLRGATELLASTAELGVLSTVLELARKSLSGYPDLNFESLAKDKGISSWRDWKVLEAYSGMVPWVDYYLALRFVSKGDERAAMKFFTRANSLLRECPTWFDPKGFVDAARHAIRNTRPWM